MNKDDLINIQSKKRMKMFILLLIIDAIAVVCQYSGFYNYVVTLIIIFTMLVIFQVYNFYIHSKISNIIWSDFENKIKPLD